MHSQQFNRRITLQQRVQGRDSFGQPTDQWADEAELWAWVKAPTGSGMARHVQAGNGLARAITPYSIRIRYRPAVLSGQRVLLDGQVYAIVQVSHDHAARAWTDLLCEHGGSHG